MTARDCEVRETCRHGFHILLAREAPRFEACPDEANFVGVPPRRACRLLRRRQPVRRPRPETGCSGYGHVRARITGRGMKQTRTTFSRQIAHRFSFFTPYIIPMRSNLLRRWSAPNLTRQKSQAACILHHAFVGEAFSDFRRLFPAIDET